MVSRDALIPVAFALLAITLWRVSIRATDSFAVQLGVLVGVGVVLPLLVSEARERGGSGP